MSKRNAVQPSVMIPLGARLDFADGAYNKITTSQSLMVRAKVKFYDGFTTISTICDNKVAGTTTKGFNLQMMADYTVDFRLANGSSLEVVSTNDVLEFNEEYIIHGILNRQEGELRIYVEGDEAGSSNSVAAGFDIESSSVLSLGKYTSHAAATSGNLEIIELDWFVKDGDDFTPQEIYNSYAHGTIPQGATRRFNFDPAELKDDVTGNVATVVGDPIVEMNKRQALTPYLSFDGIDDRVTFTASDVVSVDSGTVHWKGRVYDNGLDQYLVHHYDSGNRIYIRIDTTDDNEIISRMGSSARRGTGVFYPLGEICTISLVWDNGSHDLYYNGTKILDTTYTGLAQLDDISFSETSPSAGMFAGDLIDGAFSTQAQGLEEHIAFMKGEHVAGLTSRMAYTNDTSIVGDSTGNNNTGTNTGATWINPNRL